MVTSPDDEGVAATSGANGDVASSAMSTVAKGALILSLGTLVSRILGWYREKLLLGTYGDSDINGAYIAAFNVPDLLYYLLAGGALGAAFIPVFSGYIAKGNQKDANKVGSTIANLMLVAIAVGTVIQLLFTPFFVRLIAPWYTPGSEVFTLTVNLTRILCFMVFFTALSGLLTGMLNSYHHFLATTLVWNTYNLGIIFGLLYLRQFEWGPHGIYGVALGVIIGAFSMVAIQFPVLCKYGFRYAPIMDLRHEGVRRVLTYFVPVMIAFTLGMATLQTIPGILATKLGPPVVADMRAATRLVLLPMGIFAVAISTAAFPRLAQQVALGQTDEFRATLVHAIKAVLVLTIPAVVGIFVLAEPMNFLLWGGDEYGANGVRAASYATMLLAAALLGLSLMQIVNRAFFSLGKNYVPMLVALGVVLVNIPLALWLMHTPLQYGGISLAASVTLVLGCAVLIDLLRRQLGGINGRSIAILTAKVLLASTLMGVAVYFVARLEPLTPRFRYTETANLPAAELEALRQDDIGPHLRWAAPSVPETKSVG
ncbi:MAG TPA: murein biosynthesis integral membrane protein MurJ, partial [Armatimonadota bacterium]|nr:murein biosynthesis integral membrane protein MurJ [Armatimonadota bacterium]